MKNYYLMVVFEMIVVVCGSQLRAMDNNAPKTRNETSNQPVILFYARQLFIFFNYIPLIKYFSLILQTKLGL